MQIFVKTPTGKTCGRTAQGAAHSGSQVTVSPAPPPAPTTHTSPPDLREPAAHRAHRMATAEAQLAAAEALVAEWRSGHLSATQAARRLRSALAGPPEVVLAAVGASRLRFQAAVRAFRRAVVGCINRLSWRLLAVLRPPPDHPFVAQADGQALLRGATLLLTDLLSQAYHELQELQAGNYPDLLAERQSVAEVQEVFERRRAAIVGVVVGAMQELDARGFPRGPDPEDGRTLADYNNEDRSGLRMFI
jgi:hypothetical protein